MIHLCAPLRRTPPPTLTADFPLLYARNLEGPSQDDRKFSLTLKSVASLNGSSYGPSISGATSWFGNTTAFAPTEFA